MNTIDPRFELAVAFPPEHGLNGACTSLMDLCGLSHHFPRWTSRRRAAQLIFARNLDCIIFGKGNRAAKRATMIEVAREQAEWFDAQAALTDEDAERMAAEYAERRGEARLLPANVSFHD